MTDTHQTNMTKPIATVVGLWALAMVVGYVAIGGGERVDAQAPMRLPVQSTLCLPIGAVVPLAADGEAPKPEPQMFISLGDQPKTLNITVIAAYNMENGGMNFNGFSRGGAVYRVPKGWAVTVTFKNNSAVPHSAIVIDADETDKLQLGDPYFDGASTKDPKMGGTKEESFTFTPDETGKYAIACGFPGHCVGGHWVSLIIGKEDTQPSLKLGDGEAYTPTK
ncbi:MAG: hypothetical protein GC159_05320 [Phycisphaera sp.]|nr:hypothetical protein [Phycisphaera sp.]